MNETTISKSRSRRTKQIEKVSNARRRGMRRPPVKALLVAFAAWISALILLFGLRPTQQPDLMLNQRSPFTVVALTDFQSVDIDRTELARRQASWEELPVFTVETAELNRFKRVLNSLYDRVMAIHETRKDSPETDAERARARTREAESLTELNLPLTVEEALQIFPREDGQQTLDTMRDVVDQVWREGIISHGDRTTGFRGIAVDGQIALEREGRPPRRVSIENLRTQSEAVEEVVRRLREEFEPGYEAYQALTRILAVGMQPNLLYNAALTDRRKEDAARSVEPVMQTVREGETIINSGDIVTRQIIEQLTAHKKVLEERESHLSRWIGLAGGGAILLAGIFVCGGLLYIVRPHLLYDTSTLLLMFVVSLIVTFTVRLLIQVAMETPLIPMGMVDGLFPLALAAILVGILVDGPSTVALGVWVSIVSATLSSDNFPVLVVGLSVSVTVAMFSRQVVRRAQLLQTGLRAGIVMAFLLAAMGLLRQYAPQTVVIYALMGLSNGVVCGLVALLLLPLLEMLFRRTTDIRLLELSDLGHPLLQRMAMEAPGTYQHSIMVANLAQAAANAIGANALMVRVCAYFHDIGKLSKPEFFTENIREQRNPHDELSPNMSTLIITSHVKEGATMALRHKLPRPIIDSIQQHHGTGLVSYFYQRARKKAEQEGDANVGDITADETFRYSGPKPKTREMAILALADSVEATSRSIEKPSPSRIKNMIQEIVNNKWQDGQLDSSPLTFAELKAVQDAFAFTLVNMLHGRVPYPKDDENRDKQSAAKPEHKQIITEKVDSQPHTPN